MRRLFGQRGNAARQDVLLVADADTASGKESEYAAGAAQRTAKKEKKKERRSETRGKKGGNLNKDEGRTLDGFNRKTGERNSCYT